MDLASQFVLHECNHTCIGLMCPHFLNVFELLPRNCTLSILSNFVCCIDVWENLFDNSDRVKYSDTNELTTKFLHWLLSIRRGMKTWSGIFLFYWEEDGNMVECSFVCNTSFCGEFHKLSIGENFLTRNQLQRRIKISIFRNNLFEFR